MHTHQHNNGVTHGADENGDKASSVKSRLITTFLIVAFFGACSTYPILSGKMKEFGNPICSQEPTTCPVQPDVICTSNNTEAINLLQEQLDTSNANIAYLVQLANGLQTTVNTYEVPTCSLSSALDDKINELRTRQELLSESVLALSQQIVSAQHSQEVAIRAALDKQNNIQDGHKVVADNLLSDMGVLRSTFEAQQAQYMQLGALATLSQSIAQEVNILDQKLSQTEDITTRIESLQKSVSNFSCPAPILPVLVVPPSVECPLLELPEAIALSSVDDLETKIEVDIKPLTPRVLKEAPKDCILIPDAQRLVTQLVSSEVELLTQNLTQYTAQVTVESAQAISVAAGDATLHALRSFLEESVEQHEKLQAEKDHHLAQQAAIAAPPTTVPAPSSKAPAPAAAGPAIPELDFALLSAGTQVLADDTSATYFPSQWRLDQRLQRGLDYLGLPVNILSEGDSGSGSGNIGGVVNKVFDVLNLHKTVGVPEDALVPSTKPGHCWPMQGQSGNLTLLMRGAVMIESVSIDHTSSGDRSSAPKDFEVYGLVDAGRGVARLIAKGRYEINGTSAAVQNFQVIDDSHRQADQPFQAVSLRVLSNHGNPSFTCLYRFRVHGIPLP